MSIAGEVLAMAETWIEKGTHPRLIIGGYTKALEDALGVIDRLAVRVDLNNRSELLKIVQSSIGTKFISRWSDLMCNLALDAVLVSFPAKNHRIFSENSYRPSHCKTVTEKRSTSSVMPK